MNFLHRNEMPRVPSRLTANARILRNSATPAERKLWRILSPIRPRFTRQLPIGPYIADLACREAKLVIELDGSQHVASSADVERTRRLESWGWRVVRFWNNELAENARGVAEAILLAVAERLPPDTEPQAIPSRAGRLRQPRSRTKSSPP